MRLSVLLLAGIISFSANAQLVQVVNEIYYDPQIGPPVEGYPADHRTYRIYAELQDPTDFVSSLFAVAGCHSLYINAMDQIWNSPFGGTSGDNINSAFCNFIPSLCYDSFVTIGRENSASPGNSVGIISSCPGADAWDDAFASGTNLSVCDGAVYALNGDINGYSVGPQNRVLLFQLTVPNLSNFTYKLNIQIFDEGIAQNEIRYVWDSENVGCGSPAEVDGSGLGLIGGSLGCGDPEADNYNPLLDPGGYCQYFGCTDPLALNYDLTANYDNELCVYDPTEAAECALASNITMNGGPIISTNFGGGNLGVPGTCWTDQVINNSVWLQFESIDDEGLINFFDTEQIIDLAVFDACGGNEIYCAEGIEGDEYHYIPGLLMASQYYVLIDSESPGAFQLEILSGHPGCTDSEADNYDPSSTIDDGSCEYWGCTTQGSCNYDPGANTDDGSCEAYTLVTAIVYADLNGDEDYGFDFFDDSPLSNRQIRVEETGEIIFSDNFGQIQYHVPAGSTYTFTLLDNDDIYEPLANSVGVEVNAPNNCSSQNLFLGFSTGNDQIASVSGPCCIWMMDIHCNNGFNPGVWVSNIGNLPFNGVFTLTFDPVLSAVPLNNVVPPTSISLGEVSWDLDNHMPGQTRLYQCHIEGPGVDYIGQEFPIALHLLLYDEDNNVVYDNTWTLVPTVVCAYDPNDKYAEPAGYAEPHYVLAEDEIEYRIRFQNTGNFPAEFITIADTLDTETLDLSTFYPVFGSHSFTTCLHPNGLVEFTFNEIHLPDSTSDEPGSQGYVVYRIKPRLDVDPGTVINNTANIYFEINPPIITNTTWHTIYDCSELELLNGDDLSICTEGNTTLDITYPYAETLEWTINNEDAGTGNSVELNSLEAGDYTIGLTATNPLCSATSEALLHVWDSPSVSISENQTLLTATAGFTSYQWFLEWVEIDGADQQTFTAEESGNYTVAITDANGCTAMSDELFVLVIGVGEQKAGFIALYPNPIDQNATLLFDSEDSNRLFRIIDLKGREIRPFESAISSSIGINRNGISSGNYLIEIRNNDSSFFIPIIIN